MTSPLPKKRPITVRVGSRAARTACNGGLVVLLLAAGVAGAQQPQPPVAPISPWPAAVPAKRVARQQDKLPPDVGAPLPPPGGRPPEPWEQPAAYTIQTEPPSIYRVAISVESDAQLYERIRQENRERPIPERIIFPNDPIISTEAYQGRNFFPTRCEVAPYYVCHGRLYFQQINLERYGWGFGVFGPGLSGLKFLYDFVTLPYHVATEPCRRFEYNTGWCLPGDPVPLLLYPLHVSPTGFIAEVGTIIGLVAIFP